MTTIEIAFTTMLILAFIVAGIVIKIVMKSNRDTGDLVNMVDFTNRAINFSKELEYKLDNRFIRMRKKEGKS